MPHLSDDRTVIELPEPDVTQGATLQHRVREFQHRLAQRDLARIVTRFDLELMEQIERWRG